MIFFDLVVKPVHGGFKHSFADAVNCSAFQAELEIFLSFRVGIIGIYIQDINHFFSSPDLVTNLS